MIIHNTGYVKVKTMVEGWRDYLLRKNSLLKENFDYSSLTITAEGIEYKGYAAKKIIFCEGFRMGSNPLFRLPAFSYCAWRYAYNKDTG